MIPTEAIAAAGGVLVYHQRRDITSCMCGWAELGKSHATHQAQLALEAAATHMTERAHNAGHLDGMNGAPNSNPYRSESD